MLEHYREPRLAYEPGKINSCTKSVLSALICIAMDRGILPPADTPVLQYFPQLAQDTDDRKRKITLAHLLTMSAGFSWNEFGGLNSFPEMSRTPDWVQYVLSQPLAHTPGTHMEYNSGCSQLLSAILAEASGQTVAGFAEQQLFRQLGIADYRWETDPQGIHTGGFGLYLTPAEMAKFGMLYLQQGNWENRLLLQPAAVRHSTASLIEVHAPRKGGYGWHWWISSFTAGTEPQHEVPYYFAQGFGGQYIIVVPSYELVTVITADSTKKRPKADLFGQHIVPLLLNSAATS